MGLEIATISAIIGGVGTVASLKGQADARSSAAASADMQRRAQSEQRAVVASQQANDRRAQIREERVRRARIMQSSENTGTSGSSGEVGAVGSIATQFFGNLGTSLAGAQSSANISNFQQSAADFNYSTQKSQQEASLFQQIGGLGKSIFEATYSPVGSASIPQGSSQEIDTGASRLSTSIFDNQV